LGVPAFIPWWLQPAQHYLLKSNIDGNYSCAAKRPECRLPDRNKLRQQHPATTAQLIQPGEYSLTGLSHHPAKAPDPPDRTPGG